MKKNYQEYEDEAESYAKNLEQKIKRNKKKEKLENEDFADWLNYENLDDFLEDE